MQNPKQQTNSHPFSPSASISFYQQTESPNRHPHHQHLQHPHSVGYSYPSSPFSYHRPAPRSPLPEPTSPPTFPFRSNTHHHQLPQLSFSTYPHPQRSPRHELPASFSPSTQC
ncbi:hypothetical protein HanRHA438_Chr02g0066281 [Helianthus annuus]|nr:hypothetical protein HanRHA438_Chr02g0066281 [Helianthus annuus]